jgi:hypothetical protein
MIVPGNPMLSNPSTIPPEENPWRRASSGLFFLFMEKIVFFSAILFGIMLDLLLHSSRNPSSRTKPLLATFVVVVCANLFGFLGRLALRRIPDPRIQKQVTISVILNGIEWAVWIAGMGIFSLIAFTKGNLKNDPTLFHLSFLLLGIGLFLLFLSDIFFGRSVQLIAIRTDADLLRQATRFFVMLNGFLAILTLVKLLQLFVLETDRPAYQMGDWLGITIQVLWSIAMGTGLLISSMVRNVLWQMGSSREQELRIGEGT